MRSFQFLCLLLGGWCLCYSPLFSLSPSSCCQAWRHNHIPNQRRGSLSSRNQLLGTIHQGMRTTTISIPITSTAFLPVSNRMNALYADANRSPEVDMDSNSQSGQSFTSPPIPFNLAFLLLNGVAVLWGSQHVVIKSAVESFPATSLLNFWRFSLSSLLFAYPALSALLLKANSGDSKSNKNELLLAGAELGLYTFLGFAFQAIGLETTTASRSAFLLYLNVKIVPFLAAALFSKKIPGSTWLSALMAFSGTCLLSTDGGPINVGDAWCIVAAVASALFILRLESFASKFDAAQLNGISFLTVAGLCGAWVVCDLYSGNLSSSEILEPLLKSPLSIVYLGWITTALCNFLQTIGQRSIPAEKAAIIYSMDPVYGAVFSRLVLGEELGMQGLIGAGLIMLGVWVSNRAVKIEEK